MSISVETLALAKKNTKQAVEEAVTSVYKYRGSVETFEDLPTSGQKVGDVYNVVQKAGQNYAWDGEHWEALGIADNLGDIEFEGEGIVEKEVSFDGNNDRIAYDEYSDLSKAIPLANLTSNQIIIEHEGHNNPYYLGYAFSNSANDISYFSGPGIPVQNTTNRSICTIENYESYKNTYKYFFLPLTHEKRGPQGQSLGEKEEYFINPVIKYTTLEQGMVTKTINQNFDDSNKVDEKVQVAKDAAQVANDQANAAYNQANAAYNQANAAYNQANAAYNQANAAYESALNAHNAANAAHNAANNAYNRASAAYTKSNTAEYTANKAYNAANIANNSLNDLGNVEFPFGSSVTTTVTKDLTNDKTTSWGIPIRAKEVKDGKITIKVTNNQDMPTVQYPNAFLKGYGPTPQQPTMGPGGDYTPSISSNVNEYIFTIDNSVIQDDYYIFINNELKNMSSSTGFFFQGTFSYEAEALETHTINNDYYDKDASNSLANDTLNAAKAYTDSKFDISLKKEVVQELPAEGEEDILYLVPKTDTETEDIYDEYIWTNNAWEKIGSTATDLSGYYTSNETDVAIATKSSKIYQAVMNNDGTLNTTPSKYPNCKIGDFICYCSMGSNDAQLWKITNIPTSDKFITQTVSKNIDIVETEPPTSSNVYQYYRVGSFVLSQTGYLYKCLTATKTGSGPYTYNYTWQKKGIDLSNYYTSSQVNNIVANINSNVNNVSNEANAISNNVTNVSNVANNALNIATAAANSLNNLGNVEFYEKENKTYFPDAKNIIIDFEDYEDDDVVEVHVVDHQRIENYIDTHSEINKVGICYAFFNDISPTTPFRTYGLQTGRETYAFTIGELKSLSLDSRYCQIRSKLYVVSPVTDQPKPIDDLYLSDNDYVIYPQKPVNTIYNNYYDIKEIDNIKNNTLLNLGNVSFNTNTTSMQNYILDEFKQVTATYSDSSGQNFKTYSISKGLDLDKLILNHYLDTTDYYLGTLTVDNFSELCNEMTEQGNTFIANLLFGHKNNENDSYSDLIARTLVIKYIPDLQEQKFNVCITSNGLDTIIPQKNITTINLLKECVIVNSSGQAVQMASFENPVYTVQYNQPVKTTINSITTNMTNDISNAQNNAEQASNTAANASNLAQAAYDAANAAAPAAWQEISNVTTNEATNSVTLPIDKEYDEYLITFNRPFKHDGSDVSNAFTNENPVFYAYLGNTNLQTDLSIYPTLESYYKVEHVIQDEYIVTGVSRNNLKENPQKDFKEKLTTINDITNSGIVFNTLNGDIEEGITMTVYGKGGQETE